ncbi:MAG: methyltransferase domain-containing protein, partial [Gammaproteobacteria bacterium]|nr:methyltransferase domain-containing protein [Gammaproteobacteria bacterium]
DAEILPLKENSCDLIFSNLTLQWCNDLNNTFKEFSRVLKPGGLLLFTSFGPDTLIELRSSWAAVDDFQHVSGFIDMHHVGDALLNAGLADPVMDTENFTLTYSDVYKLMRDLKAVGARNAVYGRNHSLTGKQHLKAMIEEYEKYRCDGVIPATYEVVYGHAWAPDPGSQSESVDVTFNA